MCEKQPPCCLIRLMTKTEVAKHFAVSRVTLNLALERESYPQNPAVKLGETIT